MEIYEDGAAQLYRVRGIGDQFYFVSIRDARLKKDIEATRDQKRPYADGLRKLNCRKVSVDTLGKVHPAND